MSDVASAELDAAQNAILVAATAYNLSLHTADPGETGASEGGEGRKSIEFAASSGGSQASSTAQTWSAAVGGTYGWFGIWTTGGAYLRGGAFSQALVVPPAAEIYLAAGAVTLTAA